MIVSNIVCVKRRHSFSLTYSKSNVTVVCSCIILVYTHRRARIKSQPSHLAHWHSVCLFVYDNKLSLSIVTLPMVRLYWFWEQYAQRIVKRATTTSSSTKTATDDLSWLAEGDERKQAKETEIAAFLFLLSTKRTTYTRKDLPATAFSWINPNRKKYFEWLFYFKFFIFLLKVGARHKMKGRRRYMI